MGGGSSSFPRESTVKTVCGASVICGPGDKIVGRRKTPKLARGGLRAPWETIATKTALAIRWRNLWRRRRQLWSPRIHNARAAATTVAVGRESPRQRGGGGAGGAYVRIYYIVCAPLGKNCANPADKGDRRVRWTACGGGRRKRDDI